MSGKAPSIFQEPPEALDETWVHGALLGGMAGYDDESLADSYFLAGDTLIAAVLEGKEHSYDLIAPVLYVYRPGIELYLKRIVQPQEKDHRLGPLLEGFCRHIRTRWNEQVPRWITKPISEFIRYDPLSDAFRYETSRRDDDSPFNSGESWIDLRDLRNQMTRLRRAFRRVIVADWTGEVPPRGVG
jgi:hypothetical protein